MVTPTEAPKRGPGRRPFASAVAEVKTKAEARVRATLEADHRRLSRKEDVGGNPSPVSSNLYCPICKEPIHLPDLLEHAAEHNRVADERRSQRAAAARVRGKQKAV